MKAVRTVLGALFLVTAASSVAADGQFLQGDFSPDESIVVATVEQGRLTYGVTRSDEDTTISVVSALWSWQVGPEAAPLKLRLGPAIKFDDEEGRRAGLRGSVERYIDHGTGGVFLLAEYATMDRAGFLLASWSDYSSGFGGEMSVYKEADDKISPSIALTKRIPDSPVTLRAGYKPKDDRVFVGFSYSTF